MFCKSVNVGRRSSWGHPLVAASLPLSILGLGEVNLEGARPVRPDSSSFEAPCSVPTLRARRPHVVMGGTPVRVSPENATASPQVGCLARRWPGGLHSGAERPTAFEVCLQPCHLEIVSMTSDVSLVCQPWPGVFDGPVSVWVRHLWIRVDMVAVDLVEGGVVAILPDWGPDHPTMARHTCNCGGSQEEGQGQHIVRSMQVSCIQARHIRQPMKEQVVRAVDKIIGLRLLTVCF